MSLSYRTNDERDLKEEKSEEKQSSSSTIAILNHIRVFEDEKGWIHAKSIKDACMKKFLLAEKESTDLGERTMLVAAGVGIKGAQKAGYRFGYLFTKGEGRFKATDAIGFNFHHPHDTGLFKENGLFDEALFDTMLLDRPNDPEMVLPTDKIIVDRDPSNSSVKIIYASNLREYMKVNCQDKESARWTTAMKDWGCLKRMIMNFVGKAGNKGEFDLLCQSVMMDARFNPITHKNEKSITVEDLRAFYKDSGHILARKLEEAKKNENEISNDALLDLNPTFATPGLR